MLFNSLEFAIFLPLVFLLYWFVFQRSLHGQNLFLVAASYLFYGWWDWRLLFLIAFTSVCSWFSGVWMGEKPCDADADARQNINGHRRGIMIANILLNFGILFYFKYWNFFIENFVEAFGCLGLQLHPYTVRVILPVGISFYTFQALSYSIDVYRGHLRPTRDCVAFLAYVSFFPQLVAGPIERATNLLPQFLSSRTFSYPQAADGCRQILWGLFKKMVVADNCATLANAIFDGNVTRGDSGMALWIGAFCFAMQIYGDFSGYSDIAIGTSRLFGISLMRNFSYPYFSRDIAEFWRRWHISLSTWFRDYLYIPLGGSRVSRLKQVRNTFVIFMVSGLWHGANWTFLGWGALHALYFLPLLLAGRNRKNTDLPAAGRLLPAPREAKQMVITFLLVLLAWVFFRAPNISFAVEAVYNMLTFKHGFILHGTGISTLARHTPFILIMLAMEWWNRAYPHGLARLSRHAWIRYSIYWALMLILFFGQGNQQTFIYFQF